MGVGALIRNTYMDIPSKANVMDVKTSRSSRPKRQLSGHLHIMYTESCCVHGEQHSRLTTNSMHYRCANLTPPFLGPRTARDAKEAEAPLFHAPANRDLEASMD